MAGPVDDPEDNAESKKPIIPLDEGATASRFKTYFFIFGLSVHRIWRRRHRVA